MRDEDRWLSVDELAAYLGVKPDTVYTWIHKKGLPAHRMGRLWKMKRSEVDDWVRAGKAAQSPQKQASSNVGKKRGTYTTKKRRQRKPSGKGRSQ